MNPVIRLSGVSKAFDHRNILSDLNLQLGPAENLVVLGKSGTGKTVLLKCISGLLKPEQGMIQVLGIDVVNCTENRLNEIRTHLGYVFQQGALYDSMSLKENMLFPLLHNESFIHTPAEMAEQLVEENLNSVGLLDALYKMPAELSGGMRKRAGLARALMLSPKIMLYDEPTAGLDPFTAREISDLIVAVQHKKGTASIIVTHDMKCAEITADRILILHESRFIAEGTYQSLAMSGDKQISLFFKP